MKKTREEIFREIADLSLFPRSYSGRGMFGKRCLGVDCSFRESESFAAYFNAKLDQMGKGMIAYWPNEVEPTDCKCDLENGDCNC